MEKVIQLLSRLWLVFVELIYPAPPGLFVLGVFIAGLALIQLVQLLVAKAHDRKRLKDL